MNKLKTFGGQVMGKIQASQDSKDSLDKSAVKSKISGEPLDIIAHILQNVFERHHEDIKIMRKTIQTQFTVIDLLKSENASQNDDTDAQFEKKSVVGLKTLDDLIVFQSLQIKCAEQSSNGMKDWLCYFIEQSGTKLPPAFTPPNKDIRNKKFRAAPSINETVHLYSEELQTTLDKVGKDIDDIKKLYQRKKSEEVEEGIHGFVVITKINEPANISNEMSRQRDNNPEQEVECDQQGATENGTVKSFNNNLPQLDETNHHLGDDKKEKKWQELEDKLKQKIYDWKRIKDNDHSAVTAVTHNDAHSSDDEKNKPPKHNSSEEEHQGDTFPHQTETGVSEATGGSKSHTDDHQEQKIINIVKAMDESKPITDDHQEQKIINLVKEICDIHETDVTVMRDTIGKMGELLKDIKESQKQSVSENLEPESNADLTSFHDLIKTHSEQLTCAEQSSEKIKVLFCNAVELLLSPLATLDSNKEKEGSPTSSQTNTGEIRRTANTNIPTLHNEQTDRVGNNAVQSLKYFVATLAEYITQFNKAEKHMEAALLVLKKSQTKRQKEKHKTVDLQLYYDRNDEVMMNVVRCMDNIIRHELKKYKMDVTVEYCNTPENLKRNTPVLVLFINTSRLGTDTVAAIKRIDLNDRRNVALVAFHHTDVSFSPIVKGAIVGQQFDDIAGVHHMAFLTGKDVYECKENTDAINDIVLFIVNNENFHIPCI